MILISYSKFLIRAKRVSNCYIQEKKSVRLCGCSTNLGFSVENTNLGFSVGYVLCASYVCSWYQPADHSMVPGTYVQYRATSKKKEKNTWYCTSVRFVANCGLGPSTRGQGDSASLVGKAVACATRCPTTGLGR